MYNLNYIRILTRNFNDSCKFYKDTLGLEAKSESEGYTEFAAGNATLAIYSAKNMSEALKLDYVSEQHECSFSAAIIFQVDDVDAEYERLKGKGVVFICIPTERKDWNVKTAHFRDLDGNLIEINQRL